MKGLNAMGDYITTFTGKHFYPMSPDPMAICIEDIAHALSLICRGNGHVHKFWSVAEHCICCAKEAEASVKMNLYRSRKKLLKVLKKEGKHL